MKRIFMPMLAAVRMLATSSPCNEAAHREIEKDTDHGDNLRDALIDACKLRIGPPLRRHRKVSRRVRMQEAPQSNSNAEGENICR